MLDHTCSEDTSKASDTRDSKEKDMRKKTDLHIE